MIFLINLAKELLILSERYYLNNFKDLFNHNEILELEDIDIDVNIDPLSLDPASSLHPTL